MPGQMDTQEAIDAFFADGIALRTSSPLSLTAKKGWAQPDALSLDEIRAVCEALVRAETPRDDLNRSAA